ncbi:CBS domain-containing protein [Candidatus Bathyarchaeota archaeon]|nr:CBS domain-containing protein [Candidatus Bathyarchaeota archaeon]MBS7627477.1 CBS domain-containing protein [Candidatus Bathyarchaeota archaeon]
MRMMDEEDRLSLPVKYVMTSPVISVRIDDPITKVAELMEKADVGSVVVVDEKDRPVGMITERDIVKRVVAKRLNAEKVKSREVMSQPLITVDPETDLREAARLMNRANVKRLAVIYKGKLTGIVSSKDILEVTPELLETIVERAKITERRFVPQAGEVVVGYCEVCGQWSDTLMEFNGKFLCEDCREEA